MRKMFIVLLLLIIAIMLSSCTGQSNNPDSKPDKFKQTIQNIEQFEKKLINIMSQVDLIPYYKKEILEKKKEEEKMMEKTEENDKKFEPLPVTINDVLLREVLKQEISNNSEEKIDIPDDIIFIWDEINDMINDLHVNWNDLKPELENKNVSIEVIEQFNNSLNSLTVSSTSNNYLETLIKTNKLTSYLPAFIKDLNDDILAAIYTIKYHTRQIVLNTANNNNPNVYEDINTITDVEKIVNKELKKEKAKELAEKISNSISDLEKTITQKDINVLKVKASILMKNVNSAQKRLSD